MTTMRNVMVKLFALTVSSSLPLPAIAAKQESGLRTPTATSTPHFAHTATTRIIHAAVAAMLYFTGTMPIILMTKITAVSAMTKKVINAEISTITDTNPNRFSTAMATDISALNLKLTEQEKTMTTQKNSLKLPTAMTNIFISSLTEVLMTAWKS